MGGESRVYLCYCLSGDVSLLVIEHVDGFDECHTDVVVITCPP